MRPRPARAPGCHAWRSMAVSTQLVTCQMAGVLKALSLRGFASRRATSLCSRGRSGCEA